MQRVWFRNALIIMFSIGYISFLIVNCVTSLDPPNISDKNFELNSESSEINATSSTPVVKWNTSIGISVLALSADGNYVVVGSNDRIYLFHRSSPAPLWNYTIAVGYVVNDVSISADGSYIVAVCSDYRLYLFHRNSNTPLWVYQSGYPPIIRVAISADGTHIIAGRGPKDEIYLYFFNTSSPIPITNSPSGLILGSVRSLAISADGIYSIWMTVQDIGPDSPVLCLASLDSNYGWERRDESFGGTGYGDPNLVAISADGFYSVAGGTNGIYVFDKTSQFYLWYYPTAKPLKWVSISADGSYITAGLKSDNNIYVFKHSSQYPNTWDYLWNYSVGGYVTSGAISADGSHIVAGSIDTIYYFNSTNPTPLWSHSMNASLGEVAISANGLDFTAGNAISLFYCGVLGTPSPPILNHISCLDYKGTVQINWSDPVGATVYYIYRETYNITSVDGLIPINLTSQSHYQDKITANGTYYYVIVARNAEGNSSISNCESIVVEIIEDLSEWKWTSTEVISTESINDSNNPAVAVDGKGNVHVVWSDIININGAGTDYDIFYKCWNATTGSWTPIELVSTESTNISANPAIAIDNLGDTHVVWQETVRLPSPAPCDILYKCRQASTGIWTPTELADYGECPKIVVDETRYVYLSYNRYCGLLPSETQLGGMKRSPIGTWTKLYFVNIYYPVTSAIAVDNSGIIHLICDRFNHDLYYIHNIKYTKTEIVSLEGSNPSMILDKIGNIHIVWAEYNNTGHRMDILYKCRNNFTGLWSSAIQVSPDYIQWNEFPAVAIDNSTNIHVVWAGNYNRNIFYRNMNSTTGIWNPIELVSTESSASQDNTWYPAIAVDDQRAVHVVWSDKTNYSGSGTDYDIFYKRKVINPNEPLLNPILPNPDGDGIIELNWSKTQGAFIYYLYRSSSYINSIDNLIPIAKVTTNRYQDQLVAAGIYYYIVVASNLLTNGSLSNCELVGAMIIDETPPYFFNERQSLSSPQNYVLSQKYQFNITIIDNLRVDQVLIQWDGINYTVFTHAKNEYCYEFSSLGAGTHIYQWFFKDTSNNWNTTISRIYVINPSPTGLEIILNDSFSNFQIDWGQFCVIQITFPIEDSVGFFLNGTLITNQPAPLINISEYKRLGIYNVTAYYSGSQNYTAMVLTRWLTVADRNAPFWQNLCVSPVDPMYNQNQIYQFNCTWTDEVELDTVLFNLNGVNYTDVGHINSEYFHTMVDLPANENGFQYKWFANDTSGNWGVSSLNSYIINKKIHMIQLLLNSQSENYTINQWEYINISASLLEARNSGNFTIFINSSARASSFFTTRIESVLQFAAAGNYNVTCIFYENQNLTMQYKAYLLIVRDIEPPQMIHFLNQTYLNCTALQYQHSGLRIGIDVSDNVWVSHVLLCENSTGTFINRTMIKSLGNVYLISLSIKRLNYGDHLAYWFYANDINNNWQMQGNFADFFVLVINDFIQPDLCTLDLGVIYSPNFVLPNGFFRISGGNDFGGSGIDFYQYKWDSGNWADGTVGIYSDLQNGVHTLFYRGVDKAGNSGLCQNITVYFLAYGADYDNDCLTNFAEIFTYRTNLFKADTDGDGLLDLAEIVQYKTNPNDPDTDSDGVADGDEISLGANPLDPANPLIGRSILVTEIIFGIVLSVIIIKIGKSGPKRRQLKKIPNKYKF